MTKTTVFCCLFYYENIFLLKSDKLFFIDNARRTAEKGMCWVVMECNMCNMCNIQSMIEIFNQGLGNGCNICINEGVN